MRIELTKEQYKNLIELVMAGNWLINSWRETDLIEKYDDVEQHLFSFSSRFEMDDLIEYDNELQKYFPAQELEDTVISYSEEYDNETFWSELAERFAAKEAIKKHGNPTEEQKWRLEGKYEVEFSNNGIERLEVDWKKRVDK